MMSRIMVYEWFTFLLVSMIDDLAIEEDRGIEASSDWSNEESHRWLFEADSWVQRSDEMLLDLTGNIDSGLL